MMQHNAPRPCTLGLDTEALTAWGDRDLSAAEMQRLNRHVPACAACQAVLHNFERTRTQVVNLPEPDLRHRIWQGVHMNLQKSPRRRVPMVQLRQTLLAVGSILVIAVLFFAVFRVVGTAHPVVSQTPTVARRATLTVVPTTIPTTATPVVVPHLPGWQSSGPFYANSLVFSASNPTTGYACGQAVPINQNTSPNDASVPMVPLHSGPSPTPLTTSGLPLGITHDGGATWHTINTPIQGTLCHVSLDPANPLDLLMTFSICLSSCGSFDYANLARSLDGGQTWHTLAWPNDPQSGTPSLLVDHQWMQSTLFILTEAQTNTGAILNSRCSKASMLDHLLPCRSPLTWWASLPLHTWTASVRLAHR